MTTAEGTCDPKFEPVREALGQLVDSGRDVGASAAVVHEGRLVADVWAGHIDEARTTPWERDTIINVYSTTKTMTNLSALILADAGEIDLDASVGTYWPEFKAHGKESVLVRHLLGHTAGLPGWSEPLSESDLYDWEKSTSMLAADTPWWEPGTASGYHAITQGHLVGEVIRRVTGQSVGTWFAQNVAGPLGADFHIGTPPECDARVAKLIPPDEQTTLFGLMEPGSMTANVFTNPPLTPEVSGTVAWRRAEIPAANGHSNARAVAIVQSVVSGRGETHGKRLLSSAGVDRIFEEQCHQTDLVLQMPIRLGIGYGLASPSLPFPSPNTCFWGGMGGSLVVNDLDNALTVTYVMNRMAGGTLGDLRGAAIVAAAYRSFFAA